MIRGILAGLSIAFLGFGAGVAWTKSTYPPVDVLLRTGETTIGQPISYPTTPALVTAAIVTMQPGQETGWHRHDAPLFAYILEGSVTVDYGPDGKKAYEQGDAFLEAFLTDHNGINPGSEAVRILAVFMGGADVENTVARDQ